MASTWFQLLNVYSFLACAIALLWYYSRSTYNYWRKLNVKFLPPIPLVGNMGSFIFGQKAFHETLDDIYKGLYDEPYGGAFQLRDPQLIVKDPQLIATLLVKDFGSFHDRATASPSNGVNRRLDPLTLNLAISTGERWKMLRQRMSPLFTSGKLRHMYDQIFSCICLLTEYVDRRLDGCGSMDVAVKQLLDRFTIDVVGTCAFGIELNALESNDRFTKMCKKVLSVRFVVYVRLLIASFSQRLVNLLGLRLLPKEATDFFVNLTLDTVDYRRQNGVTRNDMLQLLMSLQNSHVDPRFSVNEDGQNILANEKFDEIDIAANAFLIFLAGFENTSATLSFCLYELALNDKIQQKLRSEVQKTRDKYKVIDYDALKEMPYMDAVIAETLRKYPIVPILSRVCTKDYVIPETKVRIPANTTVLVPIWSLHHDWKYYPNPEVFDPKRFMGDDKQNQYNGAYLPFGGGPRFCLGKRFAETEIKVALAHVILKYDMKPCVKTEIPLTFKKGSAQLIPTKGIWINLSKRNN